LTIHARLNKAVFASLSALFIVLVTAVIVSTSLYVRSESARRDAVEARNLAQRGFQGRYYWSQRTGEGVGKAIEYFEEAVRKDPTYALAHAALAESYVVLAGHNERPPKEALEKARAAALKALELDETVAEAYCVLGTVRGVLDWDWTGAKREFRRAMALNPGSARFPSWFAEILIAIGHTEESLAEARRAQDLDPLSAIVKFTETALLYYARRYDEAIQQCRQILGVAPDLTVAREYLGKALVQKGMHEQAIEELTAASSNRDPRLIAALGSALAVAGRHGESREMLEELRELSKGRYVSPYYLALIHAALYENDQSFECLQLACDDRAVDLRFLKAEPAFDSLRSDPRFDDLLRRMNLAP